MKSQFCAIFSEAKSLRELEQIKEIFLNVKNLKAEYPKSQNDLTINSFIFVNKVNKCTFSLSSNLSRKDFIPHVSNITSKMYLEN